MVRIYKHYAFNLQEPHAGKRNYGLLLLRVTLCVILASKVTSFSSYAGVLSSWDDFYIMDRSVLVFINCIECVRVLTDYENM